MPNKLYRGQGPLLLQIRAANGTYGPITEVGAVSAASFSPVTEELKHRESYSGKRAVDKVIETTTECSVSITVENFDIAALSTHLRSDIVSSAGGVFSAVPVIADVSAVEAGAIFRVPGLGITDLVLVDAAAAPVSLVAGVNFEPISGPHGFYRLLDKTGLVGAVSASGTSAPTAKLNAISKGKVTAKVFFLGINTAEGDEPSIVEAVVTLKPASTFSLISDEFGTYEITGDCLFNAGGFFTVDGVVVA